MLFVCIEDFRICDIPIEIKYKPLPGQDEICKFLQILSQKIHNNFCRQKNYRFTIDIDIIKFRRFCQRKYETLLPIFAVQDLARQFESANSARSLSSICKLFSADFVYLVFDAKFWWKLLSVCRHIANKCLLNLHASNTHLI